MQTWSTPLVAAAAAFLAVLLWRVRPHLPGGRSRASFDALREARARIEATHEPRARALALCDAADLTVRGPGGTASAAGLYQRAMRTDPTSAEIVVRTVSGLAKRPRRLESLLWRHLAAGPWTGEAADASRAALDALRVLHEGPLKNAVRARALAHARDALDGRSKAGG
ncbi:MAG: hypothetical protein ACREJ3_08255 [Polyangiaceae bacterium]